MSRIMELAHFVPAHRVIYKFLFNAAKQLKKKNNLFQKNYFKTSYAHLAVLLHIYVERWWGVYSTIYSAVGYNEHSRIV